MWYPFLKHVAIGPLARLYLGVRWQGRENLPRRGPYVVAANHLGYGDPVALSLGVPAKVIYVAKRKYYSYGGIGGRALAWFLTSIGQVPIDPETARTADPALATASRILGEGGVVGIFPEGTRSPDGRLYRGRTGVARLAIPLGVPVVPVGITGTRELRKPGRGWRPAHVRVAFGAPIDPAPWRDRAQHPQAWREFTEVVMTQIAQLSGQEIAGRYATAAEVDARDGRTTPPQTPAAS